MLSFLPSFVLIPLMLVVTVLHVASTATVIILLGLIKFALPWAPLVTLINKVLNGLVHWFGFGCYSVVNLGNKVEWQVEIEQELTPQGWYLIIANHKSWLDIVVLFAFAYSRIPSPKFFLKRELLMMPFIGLGAWALDMPFMQRYSREFLAKNPHLKGKDIETTRKSCEKFQYLPTTVINFVEGTRLTPEKWQKQKSPFKHLLIPKAGGIAFTLMAMGRLFESILDTTLAYPENDRQPMVDMLRGQLKRIVIKVEALPIEEELIGDYFEDEAFKEQFQLWLNQRWQHKDKLLTELMETKE